MAFKQPRVPEYRENEGTGKYIRSLVLFLKDFCMDVWTANNQRTGEIDAVREGYPVTCVCGKTGDVALTAGDVGARPEDWTPTASDVGALEAGGTAADSSKLCGKTLDEVMLSIYPVGSVYMSLDVASPASLFGGTWEQLQDRFLLGAGGVYNAGSTGGEATVVLSLAQMPKHGHAVYVWDNAGTTGNAYYYNGQTKTTHNGARLYNDSASKWIASGSTASAAGGGRGDPSGGTNQVGSGSAHNNMPPYLAVYMWKRVS